MRVILQIALGNIVAYLVISSLKLIISEIKLKILNQQLNEFLEKVKKEMNK